MSEAEKAREVADMLEAWANGLACLTDENERRAAQNYMPLLREAARILRQLPRDTIEECARVADERQVADREKYKDERDWRMPYALNRVVRASMDIASAIRKLAQEEG